MEYARPKSKPDANGESENAFYPVLIIGAGASGIAMGCQLKAKLGFEDFKIIERQSGVGGTWFSNRYPGVACDVPTALYSFSFAPHYASKSIYPTGEEYLEYLHGVVDKYQLSSKLQLNTDVKELHYNVNLEEWEVTVSYLAEGQGDLSSEERSNSPLDVLRTDKIRAKIVISSVGILVEPNTWPKDVPGHEGFEGDIIHSSRLTESTNLSNKNVVIIGSGCSAAQIVPALLKSDVASLTQIMRTPPWVEPRLKEPLGKDIYRKYAPPLFKYLPFLGPIFRVNIYLYTEIEWATIFQRKHSFLRHLAEKAGLKHMRKHVPEKYHEIMTPKYSYGCKRRIFDTEWLQSMSNENFKLLAGSVERVGPTSVHLSKAITTPGKVDSESESGSEIAADVIILANGFQATRFLHPLKVYGRQGESLHDVWDKRGGEQAYMGTAMDGFPNFFMTLGPNTFVGQSSVIISIESTVGYILKMIAPVLRGDVKTVEPKAEATVKWTSNIQQAMTKTVFAGCSSWYQNQNGFNSVLYPRPQFDYAFRCYFPRYQDWDIVYTEKGLSKKQRKLFLKRAVASLTACFAVLVTTRFWEDAKFRKTI